MLFLFYLVTPYDLDYQVKTFPARLMMQLWPSVLFTFFRLVKTSEETVREREKGF